MDVNQGADANAAISAKARDREMVCAFMGARARHAAKIDMQLVITKSGFVNNAGSLPRTHVN